MDERRILIVEDDRTSAWNIFFALMTLWEIPQEEHIAIWQELWQEPKRSSESVFKRCMVQLGLFDPPPPPAVLSPDRLYVRKSISDAEYLLRLEAKYGRPIHVVFLDDQLPPKPGWEEQAWGYRKLLPIIKETHPGATVFGTSYKELPGHTRVAKRGETVFAEISAALAAEA